MNDNLMDILREIAQDDLSAISGLREFDFGTDVDQIQLAKALWIDEFGNLSPASLEGFAEEARKDPGFSKKLWHVFLSEIRSFLCTKSKKYDDTRKEVSTLKGKSATIIIAAISAAVSRSIGLEAGLLVPFVAIIIHSVCAVGANVACKLLASEIRNEQ